MIASRLLAVCTALCLLVACQPRPPKGGPVQAAEFDISTVAKSDADMMIEINLAQSQRYLYALARKLYARNPNQLRRSRVETPSGPAEVVAVAAQRSGKQNTVPTVPALGAHSRALRAEFS